MTAHIHRKQETGRLLYMATAAARTAIIILWIIIITVIVAVTVIITIITAARIMAAKRIKKAWVLVKNCL